MSKCIHHHYQPIGPLLNTGLPLDRHEWSRAASTHRLPTFTITTHVKSSMFDQNKVLHPSRMQKRHGVFGAACIHTIICTKGFANLRWDHDAVRNLGGASRRVAWRVASQEVPEIASYHLRRRPTGFCARLDASNHLVSIRLLRALHPYVRGSASFESQLGNSGRYVAGKTAPGTVSDPLS